MKEYNEDDEYMEVINLTSRKKSSHELSFKQTADGGYFLIAYSLSNATFRDNSGSIVSIKVKADDNLAEGNYGVILSNVIMVTPEEEKISQEDYSGTITIQSDSGVESIVADEINITSNGHNILVNGLNGGDIADLYDVTGIKVGSFVSCGSELSIDSNITSGSTIIIRISRNKKTIKTVKYNR